MLFSILVPVYNSEQYLNECVDSVLHQSEQDFELVLVNDGSLDGGGMLCDRYRAMYPDRVRVVHQPNRGLILARRAGIAIAKGDYCVFLDADDALEPECLATVRETIERTDADIVIYNNYSYFETERMTEPNKPVFADNTEFIGEGKRAIYEVLLTTNRLNNIWMKAIRTPLLQADDTPYDFYADNPHGEDLLQTLYPVTHANHIVYRDCVLYRYRRHSRSITRRLDAGRINQLMDERVTNQLKHYMSLWGLDTQEYLERFQARRLSSLLIVFWQHFRVAETSEQKRTVLDHDWNAYINRTGGSIRNNRFLSLSQRVQIWALTKKHKMVLECIGILGTMKMRAAYGD